MVRPSWGRDGRPRPTRRLSLAASWTPRSGQASLGYSNSTGTDPQPLVLDPGDMTMERDFRELLTEAYERFRSVREGRVADYIPALAAVPADLFGVSLVGTSGNDLYGRGRRV